jgi:uncharacterized protein YecT (DUF1311 family)
LLALLPLSLAAACAPPPSAPVSTEAAFGACEVGALAELRRRDPATREVRLDPIGTARVERPGPPPKARRDGVALVIAGRGSALTGPGGGGPALRYACLVGTGGEVLFIDVAAEGGGQILEECGSRPGKGAGDTRACLRNLAASAESALTQAEAEAISRARRSGGGRGRAEVDDPAAASIGAWRVYRDSECARRHAGAGGVAEEACLVELTRSRVRELRQG